MATTDQWLTQRPELTTVATDDICEVVDVSDVTSPQGTTKKIQVTNLLVPALSLIDNVQNFSNVVQPSQTGEPTFLTINDGTTNIDFVYNITNDVVGVKNNGGVNIRFNYRGIYKSDGQNDVYVTPTGLTGDFLDVSPQPAPTTFLSSTGASDTAISLTNDNDSMIYEFIDSSINIASPSGYRILLVVSRSWAGVTLAGHYVATNLPE